MSKPRIFISSTCYDLNDIRSELTDYLIKQNFEVLNSQLKNFGVAPGAHSHNACLEQINNTDYFVLIIGGRRGGTFIGSEKSITNEEYLLAVKKGIPIIIFLSKRVNNAIPLYKKNPSADFTSVVQDIRVFSFIDYIRASSEDNWIFEFENVNDIKDTLKAQFAFYLLLFSQGMVRSIQKQKSISSSKLTFVEFPSNLSKLEKHDLHQEALTTLTNGAKKLHRHLANILTSDGRNSNKQEKLKALWVLAKYGEVDETYKRITIDNNVFKEYAWSTSKGERVAAQCKPYGIHICYDEPDEFDRQQLISLTFEDEDEEADIAYGLKTYVNDLITEYGNDEGYKKFIKADFRIYLE